MGHPFDQPCLRLLLVRHGQTEWNSSGRFMGQKDICLDETGLRQVEAVARRLRHERPAAIYSSDLQRAWQTASAIHQAITNQIQPAPPPPLISDPRLREMCFGEWEGLTYPEIESSHPEMLNAWQADYWNCAPPGGESMKEMGKRVREFLIDVQQAHPDEVVLVVAHGGTLEILAGESLNLAPGRMWQFYSRNTGISEFKFYPAGAILSRWNDTCHLEQIE